MGKGRIYTRVECGGCGNQVYEVFATKADFHDGFQELVLHCRNCGSDTIISISQPYLEYHWGKGSEGVAVIDQFSDPPDVVYVETA